ncbi:hypothetical protein BN946_scf184799.g37 [Trametes cinnabarina]|uniref:JmjC domain-containing protein n=1 Tax=Pycnoporus cinnabarinus TaxID=5643 RepID=A0A060S231_PYCCI|nr:hypothetical protein BN946_scf184799.g37 [Trametes cinnabarina]
MCFSENGGSSFWFMTAANDACKVAEYFQKKLRQELDWETRVTTVEELGNAPFTVYVTEQKVGDLVLVPPRSCHQVVNSGGLAMKTSWSRMTLNNLDKALHCELPIYRRVCRPEQYRVKTVLYRSILQLTEELQKALDTEVASQTDGHDDVLMFPNDNDLADGMNNNPALSGLVGYRSPNSESPPHTSPFSESTAKLTERARKLKRLVQLFDEVLHEEFSTKHAEMKHVVLSDSSAGWTLAPGITGTDARGAGPSPAAGGKLILQPPVDHRERQEEERERSRNESHTFACDFCGADLFQSFFECKHCREPGAGVQPEVGDGLLICPGCYVEGRSCVCGQLEPVQCRSFDTLLLERNAAAEVLSRALPPEDHIEPLHGR